MKSKYSTVKTKENARKSFESVTGKSVHGATVADVEQWLNSLREMGRSINTCRTYLSFVQQLAGLKTELPKRVKTEGRELSNDEIKRMLGTVKPLNYALLASLVLCGEDVLSYTWNDVADVTSDISMDGKMLLMNEASRHGYDTRALLPSGGLFHFVNGPDLNALIFITSAHEINRRLKSIARKAGIGDANINITSINAAHKRLMAEYRNDDQVVQVLGMKIIPSLVVKPMPNRDRQRDSRLHGIGRRSVFTIQA